MATFPSTLTAGDTFRETIRTSFTDSAGFTVTVKITGPSGSPVPYSFNATAIEDDLFEIHLLPANTAAFGSGVFRYAIIAADGTDEFTIEHGRFNAVARVDLDDSSEFRTHERKTLDAIEAVIERRASTDQQSYSINGRTLNRIPIQTLLELRKYYRELVSQQEGTQKTKLYVRMKRG